MARGLNPSDWQFVHICDMQPGSPRSFRFRPAHLENQQQAYRQIRALQPELLLVGGDITRDGSIHDFEFEEAHERLKELNIPYYVIPGNMDTGNKHTRVQGAKPELTDDLESNMTSESLQRFQRFFGAFPWTFLHRGVRFTGFYEAVAGSGLPEEKILWEFLEKTAALPPAEHHVVLNHYPLFVDHPNEEDFDIRDREAYHNWYFAIDKKPRKKIIDFLHKAGVGTVLSGHIHCRRPVQEFDGVRYFKCAATGFGQWPDRWPDGDITLGFYRFHVCGSKLREEFVPLENVSTRTDSYGPGGHPRPEQRDYSLAWEKD
ncbi:MAG: metallophosphoesterase family protein [Chthoniobacterales bacterium]